MGTYDEIFEITFAKLYGEIDHYTFTSDVFTKLYSCRLILSAETLHKLLHNYETEWEKNR